nr:MAG TPA: hypothetical protein [Caudoviricetes sp.]
MVTNQLWLCGELLKRWLLKLKQRGGRFGIVD